MAQAQPKAKSSSAIYDPDVWHDRIRIFDEGDKKTAKEIRPGDLEELGIKDSNHLLVTAVKEGRIVGIARYRVIGKTFYVSSLWLESDDKKIAERLIRTLIRKAHKMGFPFIDAQIMQERFETMEVLRDMGVLNLVAFFVEIPTN